MATISNRPVHRNALPINRRWTRREEAESLQPLIHHIFAIFTVCANDREVDDGECNRHAWPSESGSGMTLVSNASLAHVHWAGMYVAKYRTTLSRTRIELRLLFSKKHREEKEYDKGRSSGLIIFMWRSLHLLVDTSHGTKERISGN